MTLTLWVAGLTAAYDAESGTWSDASASLLALLRRMPYGGCVGMAEPNIGHALSVAKTLGGEIRPKVTVEWDEGDVAVPGDDEDEISLARTIRNGAESKDRVSQSERKPQEPRESRERSKEEAPSSAAAVPEPLVKNSGALHGDITDTKPLGGGASESMVVTITTTNGPVRCVYKPIDGEDWGRAGKRLSDNRAFSMAEREAVVCEIDEILGLNLTPRAAGSLTVLRDIGGRVGSVQPFVEGSKTDEEWTGRPMTDDETFRLAALDWITGSIDRSPWNLVRSADGAPVAIDNGQAFSKPMKGETDPFGSERFRSMQALHIEKAGIKMSETLRSQLEQGLGRTDWKAFADKTTKMDAAERTAFLNRVEWFKERARKNDFADALKTVPRRFRAKR